jgi:hypothetical protein
MSNIVRSARGDLVDFQLLAIKSQLAAKPTPKQVQDRKIAIEEKEGIKPLSLPVQDEVLSTEQSTSVKSAPKRK